MKKVILTTLVLLIYSGLSAQNIRFGVKGAFNSTWLFNNNISDRGDEVDYASAWGNFIGLTTTLHFTDESAVTVDIIYTKHTGKFKGVNILGDYEISDKITYLDVPVLFRLGPADGEGYIEIGPQFCFLSGAKEDVTLSGLSFSGIDYKSDFSSMHLAAILGFGYSFSLNENWAIEAGLRFGYGFGDATKEITNKDAFDATDHSAVSDGAHYSATGEFDYKPTHRAFGGLVVAILYNP